MLISKAYNWLTKGQRRQFVILRIKQPITAKQLAARTDFDLDSCSFILSELSVQGLVFCLNPQARRSRLYWLTELGKACQIRLRETQGLPQFDLDFPKVDWDLYGWICYSHRAAVLKTLTEPMQPATIKRRARLMNDNLKMSANNVRDIVRLFLKKGLIQAVKIRKKAHLRYELTLSGKNLRKLLFESEVVGR